LSAEQPRSLFRSGRAVQKLGVDVLVVLLNSGALVQASYRFTAYDVLPTLSEGESHWIWHATMTAAVAMRCRADPLPICGHWQVPYWQLLPKATCCRNWMA